MKKYPQDLRVLINKYENILKLFLLNVKEIKETTYWDRKFYELDNEDENGIKVLIIPREKR